MNNVEIKTAVIMTAGTGTRFGRYTENIPKGFIECGGVSMIERSVRTLLDSGIDHIIIGTGYHKEKYEALASKYPQIECVYSPRYAETNIIPKIYQPGTPYIRRNVLLNPGPATTTDTVKMGQVVPDICPREKEFAGLMEELRSDLCKLAHAPEPEYTSVLFCGSGTINIDICINSLVPEGKKILVVNNGAYNSRAVEVCQMYHIPHINLKSSVFEQPNLADVEKTLKENPDVAVVYCCHHETGTGVLNPIREIGALAHKYGAIFISDTTSSLGMIPFDMVKDNVDFCMASAQKGLMAMSGLSFVIGRRDIIEASKNYPTRSYYCNLYMQYECFEKTGGMHFTPPVQTIYAAIQALKEYFEVGEEAKWARHHRVYEAIRKGVKELGFEPVIDPKVESGLVVSVKYPNDPNWDFEKVHDYCYERGFTIYPGKITTTNTFRLCALGTIDVKDMEDFFIVLSEGLRYYQINSR